MEADNANVSTMIGPHLLEAPHVLPLLMELFAGDSQPAIAQEEHLVKHLTTCHYCRTAVMILLSYAQEYDRRNNNPEEPTRDLLKRFADISHEIEEREVREAQEFERLGAYAEAIVTEGREKATQRFPDVAAHLKICPDCRSALDATVATINRAEETD